MTVTGDSSCVPSAVSDAAPRDGARDRAHRCAHGVPSFTMKAQRMVGVSAVAFAVGAWGRRQLGGLALRRRRLCRGEPCRRRRRWLRLGHPALRGRHDRWRRRRREPRRRSHRRAAPLLHRPRRAGRTPAARTARARTSRSWATASAPRAGSTVTSAAERSTATRSGPTRRSPSSSAPRRRPGDIVVDVAGKGDSNPLPFTVRAGNIYFVSSSGERQRRRELREPRGPRSRKPRTPCRRATSRTSARTPATPSRRPRSTPRRRTTARSA